MLGRAALSLSDKCCAWEPSALPRQLLLGQWGAAGGEELSNTSVLQEEWHCCSHVLGPQTVAHTHGHGSKPYSIKISPDVLYLLESSLNTSEGWMSPHPRGQQTPRGRCVFVSDKVFARTGETTGKGVRAPWLRGKGEKKILHFPVFFAWCWLWFSSISQILKLLILSEVYTLLSNTSVFCFLFANDWMLSQCQLFPFIS